MVVGFNIPSLRVPGWCDSQTSGSFLLNWLTALIPPRCPSTHSKQLRRSLISHRLPPVIYSHTWSNPLTQIIRVPPPYSHRTALSECRSPCHTLPNATPSLCWCWVTNSIQEFILPTACGSELKTIIIGTLIKPVPVLIQHSGRDVTEYMVKLY